MKNLNLSAIISGYKTVFENLPDGSTYDYPALDVNYDYDDILDCAYQSLHDVMSVLLRTQEFAFVALPDGWYMKIFATVEERDAFINNENLSLYSKATVVKISYDEFLSYAQDNEFVLPCYCSNPDDNCVDFSPMGFYNEEDNEEDLEE